MDDIRVLALRADAGGCAFYRVIEPANVVHGKGFDVQIATDLPVEAEESGGWYEIHDITTDVDLIIMQRPLLHAFAKAIPIAQRKGIAVVVELDDDFQNVDRDNIAWRGMHPSYTPTSNYTWVQKACALADHVTVSTPALKRYAPHGRVSVVRNRVPEALLEIKHTEWDGPPRIGWTGTVQTHPHDLRETYGNIGRLVRDTGALMHVVGDGAGVAEGLGITVEEDEKVIGSTGWVALDAYHDNVAEHVDVGIVPLADTAFNRAKSYLKGLEYAALGIPFVASNLDEYKLLADAGVGDIAYRRPDWYKKVNRLIASKTVREDLGETYREIIREKFTYEANWHEWARAWETAVEHRRSVS